MPLACILDSIIKSNTISQLICIHFIIENSFLTEMKFVRLLKFVLWQFIPMYYYIITI